MTMYPKQYRPSRFRVGLGLFATTILLGAFGGYIPDAHATSRCAQYEPELAARGLPVAFFSEHMAHESRCNPLAFNVNSKTHDLSLGLMMVNLYQPDARAWFVAQGFTYDVLLTVRGNLNATVALYNLCGEGAWLKTNHGYGCAAPVRKAFPR